LPSPAKRARYNVESPLLTVSVNALALARKRDALLCTVLKTLLGFAFRREGADPE